jgi:hypothetical protein
VCLAAEGRAKLPRGFLLAIASRETNCANIVGDGGHGRGLFQVDDRFHGQWLARVGAGRPGGLPSVEDGAAYAAELLTSNFSFGRAKGLRGRRLLKFAASAYNAGAGGAWKGVQEAGDSDAMTTGRDYGADVLRRMAILRGWLGPDDADPGPASQRVLRRGDVGPDVLELKRRLRAWFEANQPVAMPDFRLNTSYGPAFVSAVEVFQRVNGLDVDGVAGPQVWGALDPRLRLGR